MPYENTKKLAASLVKKTLVLGNESQGTTGFRKICINIKGKTLSSPFV